MASSKAGSYSVPERSESSHTVPERSEDTYTSPERSVGSHTVPASSDKVFDHQGRNVQVSSNNASTKTNISEKTMLLDRIVQSRTQVNVKVVDDIANPTISGCLVMPNGIAVLCDYTNKKIKLLNSSGVVTGTMLLSSAPWDVSARDATSVIVTIPADMLLQVVQVFPQLKPGRVIKLDKQCRGVEIVKDQMYVTFYNESGAGEIRVLNLDGKIKRRLGVHQDGSCMFIMPRYIAVNRSCNKIFVSDCNTDTVTCMSVDGRVIYTYKEFNLGEPRGLICDSEDNIYVCGLFSRCVQVLTADGKRHCTLLTESGVINTPFSIAYRDSDNTLLVGCWNNGDLLSFQLSK